MRRLLAVLAVLIGCLTAPALTLADGDPGSDELVAQNLFFGSDAGITIGQQTRLDRLLNATARAGAPVRVAIIAKRGDLGTVPSLFNQPQRYANYLGYELSLTYTGRLLIVMPTGYGFYWSAHQNEAAPVEAALAKLPSPGRSAAELTAATQAAVSRVETTSGAPKQATEPASRAGSGTSTTAIAGAPAPSEGSSKASGAGVEPPSLLAQDNGSGGAATFLVIAVLILAAGLVAYRWGLPVPGIRALKGKPHILMVMPLVVLLVVAGVASVTHGSASDMMGSLATNPNLDPGTSLGDRMAPNFKLTDEAGKPVRLSQYRGKVVVLAFIDAECQTICPLTSAAMLDAKRELGPAAGDVQLLAVDANWKSTQVDDVLQYTETHGMLGQWHFLTGTLPQLAKVWTSYDVNEKALERGNSAEIEHIPDLYVIDPQGRERTVFQTQPNYASIPQLGQLIADDASNLLPSHPKVSTHYRFGEIRGVNPTESVSVPRQGGGSVKLGPGKPHLYLFFATWDTQTTAIAAEMDTLDAYARAARRRGLPALTAVDEGSVEPDARALPAFLHSLDRPLAYPVAIDTSGQLADGYQVEGEPWFVETDAQGSIVWAREVYTQGWPTLAKLEQVAKSSLVASSGPPPRLRAALRKLRGSPRPLANLHAQAAKLLTGGQSALDARIRSLRGYPIVVNIWGSWCRPCRAEFGYFAKAAARYGKRVAFIGVDFKDSASDAAIFLRGHPVSYPSYQATPDSIEKLLPGGVEGTPTTVYISPQGKVLTSHPIQYDSQGSLDADIQSYALGASG